LKNLANFFSNRLVTLPTVSDEEKVL
jgi:hypothetical protein